MMTANCFHLDKPGSLVFELGTAVGMMLTVINSALTFKWVFGLKVRGLLLLSFTLLYAVARVRSNIHFVYTILVRKALFEPFRGHARFAYEIENIYLVSMVHFSRSKAHKQHSRISKGVRRGPD